MVKIPSQVAFFCGSAVFIPDLSGVEWLESVLKCYL